MTRKTRRTAFGVVALAALSLLTAALAMAAPPIKGTDGPDSLTGTDQRDRIVAGPGADTVDAKAGRDRVQAGSGNDIVEAGLGHDVVRGGYGNDTLNGGPGPDLIFAQRGVDTVNGGEGNDKLWALARGDVTRATGEPADTVNGGEGNDRIHVRDGEADTVTCGPGYDIVRADRKDKAGPDCEVLQRRSVRKRDDADENKLDD